MTGPPLEDISDEATLRLPPPLPVTGADVPSKATSRQRTPTPTTPMRGAPESDGVPVVPAASAGTVRGHHRVQAAVIVLLMVQVAVAYRGFFAGTGFLLSLGGAVLLAGVLAAATSSRLRKIDLIVPAAAGGWLVYALAVLFGGAGPAAFAGALRESWADLLTVGLPADPTGELLLVPSLLLWAATFAAVVLAGRTESVLLPLLPTVLAQVATLVVTAAGGRSQVPLTGCFTFTALVLVLFRTSQADGTSAGAGTGWSTFGLPLVAGAAVVATVGASVLPLADGDQRFDPREHRTPPVEAVSLLDPLAQVQVQLRANPPRSLFTASLSATGGRLPVDRLRIAALGDFDGATWVDDGLFLRAGGTLPQDGPAVTAPTTRVGLDVSFESWGQTLLPAVGVPVALHGREVSVQAGSGAVAATSIPRAGDGYQLRAEVSTPGAEDLRLARAAVGPATDHVMALPPGLAPELTQIADEVTGAAATPYDKLVALERYLRDPRRFPYDGDARPGHSYGVIARFLGAGGSPTGTDTGTDVDVDADSRGYAEQHAAAFAVLARTQGFPTRVAVGYLLDQQSSDGHGVFHVTTRQAHAWPEVALEGLGWVPFEPTDISRLGLALPPVDRPITGDTSQQEWSVDVVTPVVVPQLDPAGASTRGGPGTGRRWAWLRYPAAVAAMALLLLALVPAEKRRRRRRRRRVGTPTTRTEAAWREVGDRLAEHGLTGAAALTPREAAARAGALPDCAPAAHHLGSLAPLVTRALFAAAEPGEDDARQAWQLADLTIRDLGRRPDRRWRGHGTRIRAAFDPRPLLSRSGRSASSPATQRRSSPGTVRPPAHTAHAATRRR
ncbi:transglutaminase domain-containing protein [Parafrankia sp. BMG5.11]|uniref:transglutaminase domain-containing protein n=1 Tax=Parafrankia sp. BMG5.11 TaxID=222540 RepID=UPI00103A19D2|nr:transglutaminase domain-containing protein [Parafrankia sp. BMG5.11]TCJ33267.1 DUF4129 domain-containing protein [Parafrankia sp. BMG5.11]